MLGEGQGQGGPKRAADSRGERQEEVGEAILPGEALEGCGLRGEPAKLYPVRRWCRRRTGQGHQHRPVSPQDGAAAFSATRTSTKALRPQGRVGAWSQPGVTQVKSLQVLTWFGFNKKGKEEKAFYLSFELRNKYPEQPSFCTRRVCVCIISPRFPAAPAIYEAPRPGIKSELQLRPMPQLWQCWIKPGSLTCCTTGGTPTRANFCSKKCLVKKVKKPRQFSV